MKCPVCNTKGNDNTQICQICAWEFSIWVSEISDEQRNLYNQKLKIAQNNWQKLKQMEKKFQTLAKYTKKLRTLLEKNNIIELNQSNKLQPVKPPKTQPPDLLIDLFETENEYRSRIKNYGSVKAGTVKLIKEKYDIKTGKFPIEIKKDKWIDDNYLFDCHDPYIIAQRDIAQDIYQKSQEYPLIVHLDVYNRTVYIKTILLDANPMQLEVKTNLFVDPITKMEFILVPEGYLQMDDGFVIKLNNKKNVPIKKSVKK